MDSKSIHLKEFNYDGRGGDGVFFWVGHGPQPSSKGIKVPDELGYLEPLNAYGRQVMYSIAYAEINAQNISYIIVQKHI